MSSIAAISESDILTRVIAPDQPMLSPAVAEAMLELRFPDEDRARMDDLAAKAQSGTLSAEEKQAVESYERVGTFLALLKSKARQSLKQSEASGNA